MRKFCTDCGTKISETVKFCPECGAKTDFSNTNSDKTETSVKNNKESVKFWYNQGIDFSDSKEYEKALDAYNHALAINDKDPDIWCNKCSVLIKLKRYEDAIKAGNIGVELAPNDLQIWDNLRDAYIGNKNNEMANECLIKIYDLKNSWPFKKEAFKQLFSFPVFLMVIVSVIISFCIAIIISIIGVNDFIIGNLIKFFLVSILFWFPFYVLAKFSSHELDSYFSYLVIILIGLISTFIIFFYPVYIEIHNPSFDPNAYLYHTYSSLPSQNNHEFQGNIYFYIFWNVLQFCISAIAIFGGIVIASFIISESTENCQKNVKMNKNADQLKNSIPHNIDNLSSSSGEVV